MTDLRRAPARALMALRRHPELLLPLLASLLVLYATTPLWGAAISHGGDDLYHLGTEGQLARALARGASPFGPLDLLWGAPILYFYQPLSYLLVSGLTAIAGPAWLVPIHNLLLILCFACSPWALHWSYRRLGLGRWAAATGGLLAVASVAGFGNSFEAYFETGVVTQALGALLFPLFLGAFAQLLRGQRGAASAAALFALTVVSHVVMAIYAVLCGVLLLLCDRWPLRRLARPLLCFALLCVALSAFWVVPFYRNQHRYQPIPSGVLRVAKAHWYYSVSEGEMTRLLLSGRLLDDAAEVKRRGVTRDPDDDLIDQVNIAGTLITRPPVLTVLALAGLLLALTRLRRRTERYLATGFAFTLVLFLGSDHVGWLRYVPLVARIQVFRIAYLMEYFAGGLAGLAVIFAARRVGWLLDRIAAATWWRHGARGALAAGALAVFSWHVLDLAAVHVKPRTEGWLQRLLITAEPARADFPLRIQEANTRRDDARLAYLALNGLPTVCGHFRGVASSTAHYLCPYLRETAKGVPLARWLGIGYHLAGRPEREALLQLRDDQGKPWVGVKAKHRRDHLLFFPEASFVTPARQAVLVLADDAQWSQVGRAWYKSAIAHGPATLLPVRVGDAELTPDTLAGADAVWVLTPELLSAAGAGALGTYSRDGGLVVSPVPLDGVSARVIEATHGRLFDPPLSPRRRKHAASGTVRQVTAHHDGPYVFAVDLPRDAYVFFPMHHYEGWQATVDGAPVPLRAAGPDFLAARVPAGAHEVRFDFSLPGLETTTLVLSGLTWLLVLEHLVRGAIRRRRRRARSAT